MTVGILYDRIRWEEKEIARCLESSGVQVQMIDAKSLVLSLPGKAAYYGLPRTILERCVSFYRGLSAASILEMSGTTVLNSTRVLEICGSKLLTSKLLSEKGIATPKTAVAFSSEAAIEAIESIGYPCVMKPVVGSWGRQVVPIRDRETAEALLEMREMSTGDSMQSVFYFQEMIDRPPRDIRCITIGEEIAASVYRYAPKDSWKTNVALGGQTQPCQISKDLEELVLGTAGAIGGGILGIDVMESKATGRLLVSEVNGTVEFRGAQSSCSASIADAIAQNLIRVDKDVDASVKVEESQLLQG